MLVHGRIARNKLNELKRFFPSTVLLMYPLSWYYLCYWQLFSTWCLGWVGIICVTDSYL